MINNFAAFDVAHCCPLQSCTAWTWRANTAYLKMMAEKSRWCLWGALSVQSTGFRSLSPHSLIKVGSYDVTSFVKNSFLCPALNLVSFFFPPGAVILLGRTNMFRFNHPKEAAKLREKRKVIFGGHGGQPALCQLSTVGTPIEQLQKSFTLKLCWC